MKFLLVRVIIFKANFRLIVSLFTKKEKQRLILVLLAILITGFIELLGVGSLGPFITIITNPSIIHSNAYLSVFYSRFNFPNEASFITAFGIAVICILTLSNLFLAVLFSITYFYAGNQRHSLSMRLFEKYLRQHYVFFLNINSSSLVKTILDDVTSFINNVLTHFLFLVSSAIISLAIIILLIILNPLLALAIILVLGLLYTVIFSFLRKFLANKGKERNFYNSERFKILTETFSGIKDIKILTKEKVFLNFFNTASYKYSMNDAMANTVGDLPKYIIETFAFGGIIIVIILLIKMNYQINEFLPILTVYGFGAYRLLPLLQKIFRSATFIRYGLPIIENLNKDINMLPDEQPILDEEIKRIPFRENINLNNISFSYPGSNREAINKLSISINANTTIAFVGSTGCGKTTLIDIILGLLEPQEGVLYIDGKTITNFNRKNWQKNLGYVPQSIYLLDDTIRNNIAFGIDPIKIDEESIINASKMANLHTFISNELEKGYSTVIGERGIRLSGGQRQRIGIARAVYHDPSVLILDEATNALDSLTENTIIEAIKNMAHKKTIILVAHRITTVVNSDIIYFMDNGQIIDQGNYNELYAKNNLFRKMVNGS